MNHAIVVEDFRKLLLKHHANDLSMEEISTRAHKAADIICGAALAEKRPAEPREIGWLIEREGPEWLAGFGFSSNWTKDSLEAIRFSRRADAEKIAEVLENVDISITEHIWG